MSKHDPRLYTPREVAFILSYADNCIQTDEDYQETVAAELERVSGRTVTLEGVKQKLAKILRGFGVTKPSIPEFTKLGIDYYGIAPLPPDVRAEMDSMRSDWNLPPLSTGDSVSAQGAPAVPGSGSSWGGPFEGDSPESFNAEEQIAHQTNTNRRIEAPCIENSPELPANSDEMPEASQISVDNRELVIENDYNGATDQMTSPSLSPAPHQSVPPSRKATRKRKAASDPDPDFEPPPKHSKSVESSSSRVPASKKGVAVVINDSSKTQRTTKSDSRATGEATVEEVTKPSSIAPHEMSVIDVEELSEGPSKQAATLSVHVRSAKEAIETSTKSAPQHQPTTESSSQAAGKRKAVDITGETTGESHQKKQRVTLEEVNAKVNALLEVIPALMADQQSDPDERFKHVTSTFRTIKDTPDSVTSNLVKDLDSQRALKSRYRNLAQRLVGHQDLNMGTYFPKTPPQDEVNMAWKEFHEHIMFTVGANRTTPIPSPEIAGYISRCAEEIAHGRIPGDQLKACIKSLKPYIQSPHAQQTILSALFCRWIFTSPEPMLTSMHSTGMMKLYQSMVDADKDGLERVRHQDKLATQFLFSDADFQATELTKRTSEFSSRFQLAQKLYCKPSSDIPPPKPLHAFTTAAITLKQSLLLSPHSYRLHFAPAGTLFDALWMRAHDPNNFPLADDKAAGRKIALCLFPALVCLEPRAGEDREIEDVLCKNKSFLPTFAERMDVGKEVGVSKAVVMVL